MAEAHEKQIGLTREDLQELLKTAIAAGKAPSALEQAKLDKERTRLMAREAEAVQLARAEIAKQEARRKNCSHSMKFKGQVFHGWQGQVNSDGFVYPVCKFCNTIWPHFSAKLLPDGGKQGVNMEESNATPQLLSEMHQKSFPAGCDTKSCFVCYPKAAKSA